MRRMVLGMIVALVFITTSPVAAAEESPVLWPSFDVVEWVFGLLEILQQESVSEAELGPTGDPNGEPTNEMGPEAEPGG